MNEFEGLTDTLVPDLRGLSGAELDALDHCMLVLWLRYTQDEDSGPRMSLLVQLERLGQSYALPDALKAALEASRPDQERTALAARVRYALLLTSLPGGISRLPPGLLPRMLDSGIRTVDWARTATQQLTDTNLRTRRLAALSRRSPGDHELTEAVLEAVALCDPVSAAGREAIRDALPLLPRQERHTVLERLLPTADRDRLAALLLHAEYLEPQHVREAGVLARESAGLTASEKTTALALLYPALPPDRQASLLPRLLAEAVPQIAAAPAAALTALLPHIRGPAHAALRDFVLTRHRVPWRDGAPREERVVARLIHRAAVSRLVPAAVAGMLLGWGLELLGQSYEEAFLPLTVLATTETGLPRRCVRVAAVACALSAPDRYRDVFPYDHDAPDGPTGRHHDYKAHVQTVLSTSPGWQRHLLRYGLPRVAAWWGRLEGANEAEVLSMDALVRAITVGGSDAAAAQAEDLLTRFEAAQAVGLLEDDVVDRTVEETAAHLPDRVLPRVASLLERSGDLAAMLSVLAAHLPYLNPADRKAHATLLRERAGALCASAPEAVCEIIQAVGPHLDADEASAVLDMLCSAASNADAPRSTAAHPSSPLTALADACLTLLPALPLGRLSRMHRLLARCPAAESRAKAVAYLAATGRASAGNSPTGVPSAVRQALVRLRTTLWVVREALCSLFAVGDPLETAQCLLALATALPPQAARLARNHALRLAAQGVGLPYAAARNLPAVLAEVVRQDPARADEAVRVARSLNSPGTRVEALTALAPLLSADARQPLLDLITGSVLTGPGLSEYGKLVMVARLLPWTEPPGPLVQRLVGAVSTSWNTLTRASAYAMIAEHAPAALRADVLDEGLRTAAAVSDTTDRAEILHRLARAAADTPGYRGTDVWMALMRAGASRPRHALLADLRALAPLAAHLGGPKVVSAVCRALLEVHRVWP